MSNLQLTRAAGTNVALINATNYTLLTGSTTGNPLLTYTDSTTKDILFNYQRVLYSECQGRIFPVIRDKYNIVLTDGSNILSLTSTQIGGKNISDIKTNNNLSMDYITYVALSDYSSGTTTMSNLFSSFIMY